jgi:hypothetical protein
MSLREGTKFRPRGRLAGLVRDEAPAGTAQNRTSRAHREQPRVDDAVYYRTRLLLGDSLPRPGR